MVGVRELVIAYSDRVPDDESDVLAVVLPGAAVASVSAPLRIGLAMPVLGGAQAEVWRTELPVYLKTSCASWARY